LFGFLGVSAQKDSAVRLTRYNLFFSRQGVIKKGFSLASFTQARQRHET
jgi:hypothetical protein